MACARNNSVREFAGGTAAWRRSDLGFLSWAWLLSFLLFALCSRVLAAPPQEVISRYKETQARHQARLQDPTLAWKFGQACFDLAEYATNNTERADLAEQGIAVCRQAVARDPKSAPAHYYLGLNLGQLARTRGLSALKIIKEMEAEWTTAAELDSRFDQAGPARCLGMLYRDAPGFVSVGSRAKARQQLARAVELVPNYPENRLELIDAYLKWNDRPAARRELEALKKVLPAAREQFKGPAWAANWRLWDARIEAIEKKIGESGKIEAPRH